MKPALGKVESCQRPRPSISDSALSLPSAASPRGQGARDRVRGCSKEGAFVVRPASCGSLAPLLGNPGAGATVELGGSFRAAVTTCTGDLLPFRVPGGPVLTGLFFIRFTRSWAWAGMSLGRRREGIIRAGSGARAEAVGVWPDKDVFQED